jgi:catechol 2,3-dioxygenase-like lactoylglutathione lyase family enzyme
MLTDAPVIASLPCVDLQGARDFYGGVLGLQEVTIPGAREGGPNAAAFYQCGGGTNLLVYQRETPTTADHTAAAWIVDDIEATVDALVAKGVKMEVYDMPDAEFDEKGIARSEGVASAWFKDPEGNILAVNQVPEMP